MKIAILYYGQLRTIQKTFCNHVQNIFKDHDVDIFCHTWENCDNDDYNYVKNLKQTRIVFREKPKDFSNHIYNRILTDFEFHNTIYQNNTYYTQIIDNFGYHSKPYNILSHFYSVLQSYFLCDVYSQLHDASYNLICCMRPDLLFLDSLDYNNLDYDAYNITRYDDGGFMLPAPDATIDGFVISKPENIKIYSELFLNLPGLFLKQKIMFVPEVLIGAHARINGIKINMLPTKKLILR